MKNPREASRNSYLDVLRGVSIFGVVCIHFGGSFANSGNAWTPSFHLGLVLNQAFSFAVPLFVFISGLLAGTAAARHPVDLGKYYQRRFTRIVLPYLAASAASFFLLGHLAEWQALPTSGERWWWLFQRLSYLGIELTLYFIPMILLLYLFQPLLQSLPRWISGPTRLPENKVVYALTAASLALHVVLGILCFNNKLNYYFWARPCPLFWLFYFFSGLHFRVLAELVPARFLTRILYGAVTVALAAFAWDIYRLNDPSLVGEHFERNGVDYAYVRPVLMIFNLAVCTAFAIGTRLGWSWKSGVVELLGRRSLEIYLWHILVLYEIAWRFPAVLDWCRQLPELLPLISLGTGILIAALWESSEALILLIRQYRIILVKKNWPEALPPPN